MSVFAVEGRPLLKVIGGFYQQNQAFHYKLKWWLVMLTV